MMNESMEWTGVEFRGLGRGLGTGIIDPIGPRFMIFCHIVAY